MSDEEFTGKYENTGRIGSLLLDRFYGCVGDLLAPVVAEGGTILEVGCGAGYSTERLASFITPSSTLMGCDIGNSLVQKAAVRNPRVRFSQQSIYELAFPDKAIDVVVALEVLEHLQDPRRALVELARIARRAVIISTPREPLWRILNMMRGKYLMDLGNTPGHIQHWSTAGLIKTIGEQFMISATRRSLPWTLVRATPRP